MTSFILSEKKENNVCDSSPSSENKIETVNNHIYFYSGVIREKILDLNREIQKKNDDLLNNQKQYGIVNLPNIFLHINTGGGSLTDGFCASDTIVASKAPIVTIIEGICASAGSLLSLVGKKRLMLKHSVFLMHQLSSFSWGKYHELQDDQKNNELLMEMIRNFYKEYTKIPIKKIDEILKHDLYFDAKTCLKYGIIDEIV